VIQKNLAKSYLRYVVNAFAKAYEYGHGDDADLPKSYSYPPSLVAEMNGLLEEVYSAAELDNIYENQEEEDADSSNNSSENGGENIPDFMVVINGAGYFDFTKYGIAMANDARVIWMYTRPFYDQAPNFSRDISYLKFRTDDFSRFPLRLFAAALYGIGLVILSIPTAQTFYLLSKNIIARLF
jgi:hypothetical protein